MKRYKSKAVIVEAVQVPKQADDTAGWVELSSFLGREVGPEPPSVLTSHVEVMLTAPGDYIVRELDGIHHRPIKPYVFEKRYELIDEKPINPLVALRPIPAGTPASQCKKCPAVIYLVPGVNEGKFIPLAIEPMLEIKLGLVSTLAKAPTPTEDGYGYPHFADCPEAESFRRKD
jgi:hypothetical protein